MIGFISGDDDMGRADSISLLERKLDQKAGLYRHIESVEIMQNLSNSQALLKIKNKANIDPRLVVEGLLDDQHFDAFEIDSKFNSPLPIANDEISSSYGYRYTMMKDQGHFQAGDGDDDVSGNQFKDSINGGEGNDSIYGFDGSDLLTGGDGHDRLFGGKGHDLLNGSNGNDLLTGNQGKDHFYLSGGVDTVMDFKLGTDYLVIDRNQFTDIKLTQQADNLLISSSDGIGSMLIRDLNQSDFVKTDSIKFVDI